ncbi:hypothetical protein Agabi119p4_10766 [Agaricus bisporus var. burnettii]|uniref:Fe2OG dioxygenase domain-containing protein n=1 Tax=Agaricus bisporus var. burnettii TaxID=192524 RepID=A0A8H7EW16_AGABI|nr:hypothetical protein Agabi119p4_10766 [Agaricus bisporus var. burnettii]
MDSTILRLRDSLAKQRNLYVPWTFGVVPITPTTSTLFYKSQDGTTSSISLSSTTTAQAEDLATACKPATFGRNGEDVLDLTYRKAGKLDAGDFAWNFNPNSEVASGLFPWNSLKQGINFELYKLNVYGKDSFFKAHQDTPRGSNMFGSLVVILPFEHKGGKLVLRHRGREHAFDGYATLQEASVPSAAYIAFYSDIEHEVSSVESGNRVTITYNMYFSKAKEPPLFQAPIGSPLEHPFKAALRSFLENEGNIKAHPHLGFGLEHAYPFKTAITNPADMHLKGSDAVLVHILNDLDVEFSFYLLYILPDYKPEYSSLRLLSKKLLDGPEILDYENELSSDDRFDRMAVEEGSFLVSVAESSSRPRWGDWPKLYIESERFKTLPVTWVVLPNNEQLDNSPAMAYGNEPYVQDFYHQLCIVVTIR